MIQEYAYQALTIAGSDSGGGAGIQADLKTFQMRRVFGTSILTAVTAQNTMGVDAVETLPLKLIEAQFAAIAADFSIRAHKIGMLGTAEIIHCVADQLQQFQFGQLVLDPVMVAKGGATLLQHDAISALKHRLLPLADILTPNLPEIQALTGIEVHDFQSAKQAAQILQDLGAKTIVIKGGHLADSKSASCEDWIFEVTDAEVISTPRYPTAHTHGTGCTFSACITAELAKGCAHKEAIIKAKKMITAAISSPLNIGHGHGPVNHWQMWEK